MAFFLGQGGLVSPYLAEFLGTALLILFGNGVVANVLLSNTKGHGSGWIVITFGWGMAVFVAVFCVGDLSGAHINPAVSIGLAAAGAFPWEQVPGFVAAQLAGGIFGAILVYLFYKDHYAQTDDAGLKLATFSTGPQIRNAASNLFSEILGTFVLVFAVLSMVPPELVFEEDVAGLSSGQLGLGAIGALPVGLLVLGIGLSLGGTTGYAINPARDLGPRIAHAILPIPGKGDSDWGYSWIPVVGPIAGGVLAGLVYVALNGTGSN
jgi:glycerol uptake facilitator protein